jgi:hypothetical protein
MLMLNSELNYYLQDKREDCPFRPNDMYDFMLVPPSWQALPRFLKKSLC